MDKFTLLVSDKLPWSLYLRLLTNYIIESSEMGRDDIEQYVREYEKEKQLVGTEKQLVARTKSFLMSLFGKTLIDWPTFIVFLRCMKTTRIKLSLTMYTATGEQTYCIATKESDDDEKGEDV